MPEKEEKSVTLENYLQGLLNSKSITSNGLYGMFSSALGQMQTPHAELNSNNQEAASIRLGISSIAKRSNNPYVRVAGWAYDIMDKTGGFTDASKGLGKSNDTFNKISAIAAPGLGYFTKGIGEYAISNLMKSMSSGYANSYTDNLKAQGLSGGNYLFGRNRAKNMLNNARLIDGTISEIGNSAMNDRLTQETMSLLINLQNQNDLQGGYQMSLARAGKYGMKLEKALETFKSINSKLIPTSIKTLDEDEEFFKSFKQGGTIEKEEFILESFSTKSEQEDLDFFASLNEVPEFKEGGELNVIPEGALHAHKHHMEGADNFTKKGIPVVSEEKGGELEQQAEIERNEIIFRLEVTKKLEELFKKYKESDSQKEKDELAIEAGKLLTYEILENTEDRTGLIETIQ